jgi:hypothetical protein
MLQTNSGVSQQFRAVETCLAVHSLKMRAYLNPKGLSVAAYVRCFNRRSLGPLFIDHVLEVFGLTKRVIRANWADVLAALDVAWVRMLFS